MRVTASSLSVVLVTSDSMSAMESRDWPPPRADALPSRARPVPPGRISVPLIASTRSATVVVAIVFVTTLVPALVNPVAGVLSGPGTWPLAVPAWATFALIIAGCAAQATSLILSRRLPGTATAVTLVIYIGLLFALGVPQWLTAMHLVIALSLFLLGASRSAPRTLAWLAVVVVGGVTAMAIWATWSAAPANVIVGFVLAQGLELAAPAAGGAALGLWWGTQARRLAHAREEAERVQREHEERVAHARGVERARIARELHDVAGQHLAGLITLADAALSLAADRPGEALQLVEDVRSEGRFAAAGLGGAIADLGAVATSPADATRDLRQTSELVHYWRQRGMDVSLATDGAFVDLPTVVSTTAYRAIQEALTNAAKHAPGAWVRVEVAREEEGLQVAVENGPRGIGSTDVPGLDLGWGISGLRERVQLLRGTLWAGATPAGGWLLRLRVPIAPGEIAE